MSRRTTIWAACFTSLLLASGVSADMGRVYVSTSGVTVSEDSQKAIILHNNREEVLILGTELKADRPTPIVRFIPFPSEPTVRLAPANVFKNLAAVIAKYRLQYVTTYHSKGGQPSTQAKGVEVRLSTRLGAHDLTIVKVHDAAAFRSWVNDYFRRKGLSHSADYPAEEAIVADYVARGIDFFVLDAVDVTTDAHFVDPVVYTFKSNSLYYPLKTSNSFGGKGEIELFIVSPATLCLPGSGEFNDQFDLALDPHGHAAGNCLGLPVKASTSAMLVPAEHDLQSIYPPAKAFFGKQPVFIQSIRYAGNYDFKADVLVQMPQGVAKAFGVEQPQGSPNDVFPSLLGELNAVCRMVPERGPCKGLFESFYFDGNSHTCKSFIWGGCQGVVPFQTLEDCQKTCTLPAPH